MQKRMCLLQQILTCGGIAMVLLAGGCAGGPDMSRRAYDIPVVTAGKLDELLTRDDWGMEAKVLVPTAARDAQAAKVSPTLRIGWDESGLVVMAKVPDASPSEAENEAELYSKDCVELFVARDDQPQQRYQVMIAPGRTKEFPAIRANILDQRATRQPEKLTIEAARQVDANGYTLLVRLPWSNLNLEGKEGNAVRLQVHVDDGERAVRCQRVWYPSNMAWRDANPTYTLHLSSKASLAAEVGATAEYQGFRRLMVVVNAVDTLAGKRIMVLAGNRQLGESMLAKQGMLAVGRVALPMPAGKGYGPLSVLVEGQPALTLVSPDVPNVEESFAAARFAFTPCVFSGTQFPPCEFLEPLYVEDLIGAYEIDTTFYDAQGNVVTQAANPGRYGAMCEISTASGKVYKKYQTLYRTAGVAKEPPKELVRQAALPGYLGIDPQVAQQQIGIFNDSLLETINDAMSRDDDWAILLAGLAETKPGAAPYHDRDNPWQVAQNWWANLRVKTEGYHYEYIIKTPANYQPEKGKYPMILALHGSGGRGHDLKMLENVVPLEYAREHADYPFVLVVPQCPPHEWWSPVMLDRLLNEVQAKYAIDPDRIYVIGESMGGYGTWMMAQTYPNRFAAVAPVCGVGDKDDMERIGDLPVWVFHGDQDTTVPIAKDTATVDALKKAGGRVRYTIYPGAGHDAWTPTYRNPELYDWMLKQKRGQPQEPHVAN